ncbi:MAG: hypothetical protein Q8N22_02220 [bacterium]|nr:hypothetical protein [bacterium]
MKIYKKIILGFIVVIIILGLVAFYSPIQNVSQPQPAPEPEENSSASLDALPASSTTPDSNSINQVSTSSASEKSNFEDMSGFSDLDQESDSLKEMGTSSDTSIVDDFLTN